MNFYSEHMHQQLDLLYDEKLYTNFVVSIHKSPYWQLCFEKKVVTYTSLYRSESDLIFIIIMTPTLMLKEPVSLFFESLEHVIHDKVPASLDHCWICDWTTSSLVLVNTLWFYVYSICLCQSLLVTASTSWLVEVLVQVLYLFKYCTCSSIPRWHVLNPCSWPTRLNKCIIWVISRIIWSNEILHCTCTLNINLYIRITKDGWYSVQ